MARANVLALSSLHEGLPGVLIEALGVGTPVVATDCPSGPAEILDGGRYGRLVPMGEAHALAHAICETLDDPPAADRLIERAQVFSMRQGLDAYERVLVAGEGVPTP
jgi:glycosyltransferase involved in cell wall biosynthesis